MQHHPRLKSFADELLSALNSFERVSEWPDLIKSLARVNKVLLKYAYIDAVPHLVPLSKRLAQCLGHGLPGGVHVKSLETYSVVFRRLGRQLLLRNLGLFSSGLFPLLAISSSRVRPQLLALFEDYYLPLGSALVASLDGFLLALLPGIEDNTSETYERVLGLLHHVRAACGKKSFAKSLWRCVLLAPSARLPAVHYLTAILSSGESLPLEPFDLAVESILRTLNDENVLAQRGMLEILLTHVSVRAAPRLLQGALPVLLRREASVNRRLFAWIFSVPLDETVDLLEQCIDGLTCSPFALVSILMERVESSLFFERVFYRLVEYVWKNGDSAGKEGTSFFQTQDPARCFHCVLEMARCIPNEKSLDVLSVAISLFPIDQMDELYQILMSHFPKLSMNDTGTVFRLLELTPFPYSPQMSLPLPNEIPSPVSDEYVQVLQTLIKRTSPPASYLVQLTLECPWRVSQMALSEWLSLPFTLQSPQDIPKLAMKCWTSLALPPDTASWAFLLRQLRSISEGKYCTDTVASRVLKGELHQFSLLWPYLERNEFDSAVLLMIEALEDKDPRVLLESRKWLQQAQFRLEDVLSPLMRDLDQLEDTLLILYALRRLLSLVSALTCTPPEESMHCLVSSALHLLASSESDHVIASAGELLLVLVDRWKPKESLAEEIVLLLSIERDELLEAQLLRVLLRLLERHDVASSLFHSVVLSGLQRSSNFISFFRSSLVLLDDALVFDAASVLTEQLSVVGRTLMVLELLGRILHYGLLEDTSVLETPETSWWFPVTSKPFKRQSQLVQSLLQLLPVIVQALPSSSDCIPLMVSILNPIAETHETPLLHAFLRSDQNKLLPLLSSVSFTSLCVSALTVPSAHSLQVVFSLWERSRVFSTELFALLQNTLRICKTDCVVQVLQFLRYIDRKSDQGRDILSMVFSIVASDPSIELLNALTECTVEILERLDLDVEKEILMVSSLTRPLFSKLMGPLSLSLSQLIESLCPLASSPKAFRRELWLLFLSNDYLTLELSVLMHLQKPISQLLSRDKSAFEEILALCLPTRFFSSLGASNRCKALRRLALGLLAGRKDQFSRHISQIFEILADALKSESLEMKATVLLVMRVMVYKFSEEMLYALWPVALAEVISALEGEDEELVLQASKFIDLALVLLPKQFLLYEWIFMDKREKTLNPFAEADVEMLLVSDCLEEK